MIQELLYTSHEGRGLRQGGGGGFCTVLSTTGMAANLASTLEKLSGYKHPFDIHDARSQHNPANYRLAIVRVGGISYYVLSRIADLRREHTGRSNKLAHHVALAEGDLPLGGPTQLLKHADLVRDSWDGKVGLVEPIASATLPQGELPPRVCSSWHAVAGDAGWAGYVAEQLLASTVTPVSVIFPLGADTLTLADEVFALLPADRRWEMTFSTYYAAAPPVSTCRLRFVLDDTSDAEQLRRDHRHVVVDLASAPGRAPESALATAARTGVIDDARAAPRRAAAVKPAPAARVGRPGDVELTDILEPLSKGDYELLPPEKRAALARTAGRSSLPPALGAGRRERGRWFLAAGIAAAVLLVGSVTAFLWVKIAHKTEVVVVSKPVDSGKSLQAPTAEVTGDAPEGGKPTGDDAAELSDAVPQVADESSPSDEALVNSERKSVSSDQPPPDAAATTLHDGAPTTPSSAAGESLKINVLEIVRPLKSRTSLEEPQPQAQTVSLDNISKIQHVELLGWKWISDQWQVAYQGATLKPVDVQGGLQVWEEPRQGSSYQKSQLCEFKFSENKITFEWHQKASDKVKGNDPKAGLLNALRWCILRVAADDGEDHYITLATPGEPTVGQVIRSNQQTEEVIATALPGKKPTNSREDYPSVRIVAESTSQGVHSASPTSRVATLAICGDAACEDKLQFTLTMVSNPSAAGQFVDIHHECSIMDVEKGGAPPVRFTRWNSDSTKSGEAIVHTAGVILQNMKNKIGELEGLQTKLATPTNSTDAKIPSTISPWKEKDINEALVQLKARRDHLERFIDRIKEFQNNPPTYTMKVFIDLRVENVGTIAIPILGSSSDATIVPSSSRSTQ